MKTDKITSLEQVGNKNPFTVPEGYFENLTACVMASLPENPAKPIKIGLRKKILPWVYMAAMICGIAVGIRLYVQYGTHEIKGFSTAQNQSETIPLSDEDILISAVNDYDLYEYFHETNGNF
ncbi:MAG: hypothetical protein FWF54_10190 [Candidatus Azobacteroides sp.]|nr:hypothetical protein [Candidatus Azobacteroides sp.]